MDFVILKVNGKDLSNSSHNDIVEAFLAAEEPIFIEVLRRTRGSAPGDLSACQTPDREQNNQSTDRLPKQTQPGHCCICPRCGYGSTGVQSALSGLTKWDQDAVVATSSGGDSNSDVTGPANFSNRHQVEDDLTDEVQFKITITRATNDRTLNVMCRNLESQEDSQLACVIVDQVGDEQIRRKGLLQEGDQILQINGQTVRSAEHVSQIFSDLKTRQFVILAARLPFDLDDDDSVEELRMSLLEEFSEHHEGVVDEDPFDESQNQHEKDSGLADSCKNDDSSENDLMSPRSSKYNTTSSGGCCDDMDDQLNSREVSLQTDFAIPPPPVYPRRDSFEFTRIETELQAVALQIEHAQRQCQAAQEPSPFRPPKPPRAPRTSSLPVPAAPVTQKSAESSLHRRQSKNPGGDGVSKSLSSATPRPGLVKMSSPEFCDTGSGRGQSGKKSAKITSPQATLLSSNGVAIHLPYGALPDPANKRTPMPLPVHASAARPPPVRERINPAFLRTVKEDDELNGSLHIYEQIEAPREAEDCQHGSLTRSSGTKSASRRPVRDKILQDRAYRISQERCGMTTDDDNRSELKIGRYFTKEEKRRHLELAAEAKRRREIEKVRLQLQTSTEIPTIIALSLHKQYRRQAKKVDDFTTAEDVSALRNRIFSDAKLKPHGLPNVTTV